MDHEQGRRAGESRLQPRGIHEPGPGSPQQGSRVQWKVLHAHEGSYEKDSLTLFRILSFQIFTTDYFHIRLQDERILTDCTQFFFSGSGCVDEGSEFKPSFRDIRYYSLFNYCFLLPPEMFLSRVEMMAVSDSSMSRTRPS